MARWPKRIERTGVDVHGRTPLWHAAASGETMHVDDALSSGGDPNGRDDVGCTPLHVAVRNGHSTVVQALLASGADVGLLDKHGNSPLWTAVYEACLAKRTEANLANVKLLLEAGADPDHANAYGRTPREMANLRDQTVASLFV